MAIWTWLTGKKAYIGMGLVLVSRLGSLIFPPAEAVWAYMNDLGILLGAVGITHRVVR
jgi:hypothetical protein